MRSCFNNYGINIEMRCYSRFTCWHVGFSPGSVSFFVCRFVFNIYLAVLGLSCSLQTVSYSMWDLVPEQGSDPGPLHWEHGVLTTGPPGKSPSVPWPDSIQWGLGISQSNWEPVPSLLFLSVCQCLPHDKQENTELLLNFVYLLNYNDTR